MVSFYASDNQLKFLFFYIFMIFGLIIGLITIKPTKYQHPHKEYGELYDYVNKKEIILYDQFILDYIRAIKYIKEKNDFKAFLIICSYIFIVLSLLSFVIVVISCA